MTNGIDPKTMKAILDSHAKHCKELSERPRTLTDKLIDVQPLPPPLGLIFYFKFRYGAQSCPDKLYGAQSCPDKL